MWRAENVRRPPPAPKQPAPGVSGRDLRRRVMFLTGVITFAALFAPLSIFEYAIGRTDLIGRTALVSYGVAVTAAVMANMALILLGHTHPATRVLAIAGVLLLIFANLAIFLYL